MSEQNQYLAKTTASEYVALLPAAGIGSRLPDRSMSKELLRFGNIQEDGSPVISHVLSCMRLAGIVDVTIVLREGKQDIQDYLTSGDWNDINFMFKITPGTSGVPETVALGLDGDQERSVVFGFPDILFKPRDAFVKLIHRLENSEADVVLGLFPTDRPHKMDMVETDNSGRVVDIQIKPNATTLDRTWILAAWRPSFSAYLYKLVRGSATRLADLAENCDGSHLGHVFQLAMADGFRIDSGSFDDGRVLDIGTPDDLRRARAWLD
jgi:glucose-1-phosphate thymidylyltransferase